MVFFLYRLGINYDTCNCIVVLLQNMHRKALPHSRSRQPLKISSHVYICSLSPPRYPIPSMWAYDLMTGWWSYCLVGVLFREEVLSAFGGSAFVLWARQVNDLFRICSKKKKSSALWYEEKGCAYGRWTKQRKARPGLPTCRFVFVLLFVVRLSRKTWKWEMKTKSNE